VPPAPQWADYDFENHRIKVEWEEIDFSQYYEVFWREAVSYPQITKIIVL
jgi:hypothetical protein